MFGIGLSELILIAVVALLFVGPKKLPDLARQMSRFYVQARRAATDVRSMVDEVVHKAEDELRLEERDKIKQLLSAPTPEKILEVVVPEKSQSSQSKDDIVLPSSIS